MTQRPKGWSTFTLSDLGGTIGGKTPSKSNAAFWSPRDIHWTSPKDMKSFWLTDSEDKISSAAVTRGGMRVLPKGSVLVVTRSGILAHTLPVAITDIETTINQDIKAILPNDVVEPRYLAYLLRSKQTEILETCAKEGTTVASVQTELLEKLPLPLAPRAEQKRIADKLDRLLAAVDTCKARLDAIPAILKRFRRSVLAAAVSGALTGRDASEAYAYEKVGTLVSEPLRNGKSVRDGTGRAVLRLTAIKDGLIDANESKTGAWGSIDPSRYFIQIGDFLVARGNGSKNLVGRGGLVTQHVAQIAFPDTMIRIRPNVARIDPNYLRLVWDTDLVRTQIERVARTTAGIWKVAQGDLEGIKLPLPAIHEQRAIVAAVDELSSRVDSVRQRYVMADDLVSRLAPSILAMAYEGRLVPQDVGEAAAETLLWRPSASNKIVAPGKRRAGASKMAALTRDLLINTIQEMPKDRFSFQELRSLLSADYEQLQELLYVLLQEPRPVIRQVFDSVSASMQLVRQGL